MQQLIFIGNPQTDEFIVGNIPPIAQSYFRNNVMPYVQPVFTRSKFQNMFQTTTFSAFDWGYLIAAFDKIKDLVGGMGAAPFTRHPGWMALVSSLRSEGATIENNKFLYCNCGGATYRVWIDSGGKIQTSPRNKTGKNTRFDCTRLPPDIYAQTPCGGGGGSGGGYGNPPPDKGISWSDVAIYGGAGLIAVLILKMIFSPRKKSRKKRK